MIFDNRACMAFDERDGSLLLRHPITKELYRIRSWADRCATEKRTYNAAWEETTHLDFDIPLFEYGMAQDIPTAQYLQSVPERIQQYIMGYPFDQVSLLKVCALSERACQLAIASPNLLWYIAEDLVGNGITCREAYELFGRKRRELLKLQGTHAAEWIVRVLERLGPPPLYLSHPRELFAAIVSKEQAMSVLRRNRNISWELLETARKYSALFTHGFVRKLFLEASSVAGLSPALKKLGYLLEDIQRLRVALRIRQDDAQGVNLKTAGQLQKLHDALSDAFNERMLKKEYRKIQFPSPPYDGDEAIQPIRNYYELMEEGKIMHNCVASYLKAILSGNSYIYRLVHPERATMELAPVQDKISWRIKQILTYCNNAVSESTARYADAWIRGMRNRNGAAAPAVGGM